MEKEKFDYKAGLKIIRYMKENGGLQFSFVGDQITFFVNAFSNFCREDDLIERTKSAYGYCPFMRRPEELPYARKTKVLDLRSLNFEKALENCPDLLDEDKRQKILDTTTLNDVL